MTPRTDPGERARIAGKPLEALTQHVARQAIELVVEALDVNALVDQIDIYRLVERVDVD